MKFGFHLILIVALVLGVLFFLFLSKGVYLSPQCIGISYGRLEDTVRSPISDALKAHKSTMDEWLHLSYVQDPNDPQNMILDPKQAEEALKTLCAVYKPQACSISGPRKLTLSNQCTANCLLRGTDCIVKRYNNPTCSIGICELRGFNAKDPASLNSYCECPVKYKLSCICSQSPVTAPDSGLRD